MHVAPHHIKGTPQAALSAALGRQVDYTPVCAWPDDCMVQWGNGIIPANPFFEAFPSGTFIRGDGDTIEEAERRAFAAYVRQIGCDHLWSRWHPTRGTYTNGLGTCRRCSRTEIEKFLPIVALGEHRKPLRLWEADWLDLPADDEIDDKLEAERPGWKARGAKQKKLLRIRRHLFGADSRSHSARDDGGAPLTPGNSGTDNNNQEPDQ